LAAVNVVPDPTACCATVSGLTADALAPHAPTKHGLKVYALMAHQAARMICDLMADGPSVHGRAQMTDRATAGAREAYGQALTMYPVTAKRSLAHDQVQETRRATADGQEIYRQILATCRATAERSLAHDQVEETHRAKADYP
jgi:hypothetical protein